ncbi:MAG: DUF4147 domain-containing protein [bacterium]|nr:DUF4147 domain-containing protein [bacterium]
MNASQDARGALETVLRAALQAVDARAATARALLSIAEDTSLCGHAVAPETRFVVIAIGKAAAGMAEAAGQALAGRIRTRLVVTKDGHAAGYDLDDDCVMETGHPVPDARGEVAAKRILACVEAADPDDLLLILLSGGASALVSLPPTDVSGEDLAATNRLLLECGADISELNTVRKHLSQISGGQLVQRAAASRVAVLAISDVPGDALDVIGSGPCAPDPSRFEGALEILTRRGLCERVPPAVLGHLERGAAGAIAETPKPEDPIFDRVTHQIVACNADARRAAARRAEALGARVVSLGGCIRGEARDEGRRFAVLARSIASPVPVCVVAGGESVVVVRGNGLGGRNQELALAAAFELRDSHVQLLAVGTDGTDGPTEAAGAWADGQTIERARAAGCDPERALANNDSHSLFHAESGLLVTGPTGTNVMDLVLVWIPAERDRDRE